MFRYSPSVLPSKRNVQILNRYYNRLYTEHRHTFIRSKNGYGWESDIQ